MKTSAQKIQGWRDDNPSARLDHVALCEILDVPDLSGADLSGATLRRPDLSGADLSGAVLAGANLRRAILSGADLSRVNLSGADLSDVIMSGTTLSRANLSGANLAGANLRRADLSDADLFGANMSGANMSGADMRDVRWDGLRCDGGPSGEVILIPTLHGWRINQYGCWRDKTLNDLNDLIHDRVEWPEATGDEKERRRHYLIAVKALCEAHAVYKGDAATLVKAVQP